MHRVTAFATFKRRLASVVARAKRAGVRISAEHSELHGPVCCPLGALADLHRDQICKPDEGDAAAAWRITKNAAFQFTCGFDSLHNWGNPASPYYRLGQQYAKDYP